MIGALMMAAVTGATSAAPEPHMVEHILGAIAQIESGGQDIGVHPDGVSYGRYGVTTQGALAECIRMGVIPGVVASYDLSDPAHNARVARAYLLLMYERHGHSWFRATGWYHGGNVSARDDYAARVFDRL